MALTQKGTRVTFTGTSTPTVTFSTANLTSGSTLLTICNWEQPLATLNSVADGTNGAYTQLPVGNSGNNGSAGDGACRIGYFLTNTSTGKPTVTFTFSSGVDGVINCYEIPASTLDQHAENGGASSSAGVTIVSAAANAFLLAATHRRFGGAGVDAGISGVSDFMDLNVNSGQHSVQYSNNAGSAGNKQVDFNDTTSQPAWATAAATFVAAAAGGAMAGTTTLTFGQTGALTAMGALAGSTPLVFGQTGALTGKGALAGSTPLVFGQTGALTGSGALAGTTTLVFGQSGTLTPPAGSMAGQTDLTFGATGTMTGIGALAGTASITFGASASTDSGQSSGFGPMGAFSPSGYFPMATGVGFNKPKKIEDILEEIEEIEPQSPKIETKRPILTLKKPRVNIEELIAIQARITALADFAQSTQDQLRSKQLEEEALMLLLLM